MWYRLDKKGKKQERGIVKLRLTFGSEKDSQVAAQEHKHLLHIILLHELSSQEVRLFSSMFLLLIIPKFS